MDEEETVKKSSEIEVKDSDGEAEQKEKVEGDQVEFTQITQTQFD